MHFYILINVHSVKIFIHFKYNNFNYLKGRKLITPLRSLSKHQKPESHFLRGYTLIFPSGK